MLEQGLLVILSGPSGSGKDTVLTSLTAKDSGMKLSISMTTRPKRGNELDGGDYYFVTREYFEKKITEGSMLEYAQYAGNYYGTPKRPVDDMLARGETVILKIEVQGAEKIRAIYPDAVSILKIWKTFFVTDTERCIGRIGRHHRRMRPGFSLRSSGHRNHLRHRNDFLGGLH